MRGNPAVSRAWLPRRLRTRLFLSYVVVVAAGAVAMLVVGTVVTRTVYEQRLGGFGFGRGQGRALKQPNRSSPRRSMSRSYRPSCSELPRR